MDKLQLTYPVFILKDDSDYLVYVPDLRIYTEGNSYENALEMAQDAIGLMLVTKQDYNEEIPVPSDRETAIKAAQEDADDDLDFSKGNLVFVESDTEEYKRGLCHKGTRARTKKSQISKKLTKKEYREALRRREEILAKEHLKFVPATPEEIEQLRKEGRL